MKKVIVEIEFTGNNFSAFVPELSGCVSTGNTPNEIKRNIKEAIDGHVAISIEDNDPIPEKFKGNYELIYHFDTFGLLAYYKGIFKNSALERVTGINQKQLAHYASGHRKPRPTTAKKIEMALHALGAELLAVRL